MTTSTAIRSGKAFGLRRDWPVFRASKRISTRLPHRPPNRNQTRGEHRERTDPARLRPLRASFRRILITVHSSYAKQSSYPPHKCRRPKEESIDSTTSRLNEFIHAFTKSRRNALTSQWRLSAERLPPVFLSLLINRGPLLDTKKF